MYTREETLLFLSIRKRIGQRVVSLSLDGNSIIEIAVKTEDFPDEVSPITAIYGNSIYFPMSF
jgi:hypothetical protein